MGTHAYETRRRCSDQAKLATTFAAPMQAGFPAHQLTLDPFSTVKTGTLSVSPGLIIGSERGLEAAHSHLTSATPAP